MLTNKINITSPNQEKNVRICYVAGREITYSRTRIISAALENQGFHVAYCLPPNKNFRNYPSIIIKYLFNKRDCDLILVGFYGQLLIFFVRLFTRKPILFDVIVSTYEVMVDWKKIKRKSITSFVCFFFDKISMAIANKIILETQYHINHRSYFFRLKKHKFEKISISTEESVIYPDIKINNKKEFLVHFHGEYAPFHGVKYIIKAASLLSNENILFQLIGKGLTFSEDKNLAEQLSLSNITFIEWVPYEKLRSYIAEADVCLGVFGNNKRTFEELTNKVVEQLAMKKPIITTRSQPVLELIQHLDSAILIKPADPFALANAIRLLKRNDGLRNKIACNGYESYLKNCCLNIFENKLKSIVESMVKPKLQIY